MSAHLKSGPSGISSEGRDGKRPAGYDFAWKPYNKSKIMLGQVLQILEEYKAQLPLTVRQILYRMVAAYRYKKGKQFETSLYELLVRARRAGEIPFDAIRDDGIIGGGYWVPDLKTHLRGSDLVRRDFKPDLQASHDIRLEVWCEAAGMQPQLARVADEFSVPVYSCGGFNSLTSIRQIVDAIVDEDRDTIVLHLGDCDPSGISIFERVVEDVSAFLEEDAPHLSFDGVRVALTEQQVAEHKLPMDPITTKDSRSLASIKAGKTHKCELEALAPNVIAELLGGEIGAYTDFGAREKVLDRARLVRAALKSLPSGISHQPALEGAIRARPISLLYPSPASAGGAR